MQQSNQLYLIEREEEMITALERNRQTGIVRGDGKEIHNPLEWLKTVQGLMMLPVEKGNEDYYCVTWNPLSRSIHVATLSEEIENNHRQFIRKIKGASYIIMGVLRTREEAGKLASYLIKASICISSDQI